MKFRLPISINIYIRIKGIRDIRELVIRYTKDIKISISKLDFRVSLFIIKGIDTNYLILGRPL